MNAEFNWWLLIVGVVGGAGLLWLILGDWSRREEEIGEAERARESAWIAAAMRVEGTPVEPATAEEILRLHRVWLRETGDFDPLEDDEGWAATPEQSPETEPVEPVDVKASDVESRPHQGLAVQEHAGRPPGDEARTAG